MPFHPLFFVLIKKLIKFNLPLIYQTKKNMTKELKNIYEDLIQNMIMDGINGMTPEIKEFILNSPISKRREIIITILEENNVEHRLLCDEINKTLKSSENSEMSHIKNVVGMLRSYVKVSKTEVKTMGEVMTPIELVEEMLDTLPYEVWTNPNLKWLDPCNGVGTFFSVVIERLMKGLVSFQPDENLRYKHILENMIYACELQAKNLFLYLYAFDPKDEYALNIYHGSYLEDGFDKHMEFWGVEKFDVIVQNPPYNDGSSNRGSAHVLWDKFVIKSVSQLVECGYLVAVHPDGWRNLGKGFDKVKSLLKSKQMLYLEVHNKYEGIKTFGAGTTYDFYCLHNVPNTMFTKIKCMDGTTQRVDISKLNFIPNGMYKEFERFIAKDDEEKVNVLYNCAYHIQKDYVSKEQTEEFKFPVVYVTYKDGSINLRYSNTNEHGHYGLSKVIFSNGISCPYIDENGVYAMTQFAYAIIDEPKNLPFIQKAMLNPDFIKLMSFSDGVTGTGHRYNRNVIALFRKDWWKEYQY